MAGIRIDLHVHSMHSPDSALSLETIATGIAAAGLDGFALTDHNTVAGHAGLGALRGRFPKLLIVPGVEISTREGHLLALGFSTVPPHRLPVADAIAWVQERGGVSALSHPFRRSHGVGGALAESLAVPAIETVNGHNSPGANRRAAATAARRRLAPTGGSDSHRLEDLGRAYTVFPEGTKTVGDVLRAIREQATIADGRSLGWGERLGYEVRTALLRMRRGFRPI